METDHAAGAYIHFTFFLRTRQRGAWLSVCNLRSCELLTEYSDHRLESLRDWLPGRIGTAVRLYQEAAIESPRRGRHVQSLQRYAAPDAPFLATSGPRYTEVSPWLLRPRSMWVRC